MISGFYRSLLAVHVDIQLEEVGVRLVKRLFNREFWEPKFLEAIKNNVTRLVNILF